MDRTSMNPYDILQSNIEKIGQLFPNVITEIIDESGKLKKAIDFQLLRQELEGGVIDGDFDRYQLLWPGKKEAMLLSNVPTTKVLKAEKEESIDWDSTENLYIKGDNLDVLKILQKSYMNKIKCIYIDPPYNTGKDFIYKDDFRMGANSYLKKTGKKLFEGNESDGRFHSNWLNMMYPRLKLARRLLREDGVIFVSIDNNELHNLQIIMNEIFGESNYVETFIWTKTSTPPSLSSKSRKVAEYILCYEKNISGIKYYGTKLENGDAPLLNTGNPVRELSFPKGSIRFTYLDEGYFSAGRYNRVELLKDFEVKNGTNKEEVWLKGEFKWTKEFLFHEIKRGTYFVVKSPKFSIRFQRPYYQDRFKPPANLLDVELNKNSGVGTNESAVKELELLGMKGYFDYPKPLSLIKKILNMVIKDEKEAIVLDFFSGSATTAHAVMELNASDGGQRKYIMVQKPEQIPRGCKAYKAGYRDISEIGKERILRAAKSIKEETKANIDYGFRVYRLE